MVAAPADEQSRRLLPRQIQRYVVGALAVLAGCCLGMGALYAFSWLFADPGCRCPVERIETSRAFAHRFLAAGIAASAIASGGLLWLCRKVALPTSITSPFAVSLIVALFASSLAGFLPGASGGRYSKIPIEWLVPQQLISVVRPVSQAVQSWQFVVFSVVWVCLYVAIRLLRKKRS